MARQKTQHQATDVALSPLLQTKEELAAERRKRREAYEKQSFHPKLVEEKLEDDWIFDRKLKTKIRLKKVKPLPERLENKFWCLLHDLGYPVMNKGSFLP